MDKLMRKKILGLIPTRIGSVRLPAKALLHIGKYPLIIHVYKRAKLAKKLDDVIICCDDNKILKVAKKYGAKALLTSKHHLNGTERICEAYKVLKKKYDFVVDIQGDEPFVSPVHIDEVVQFHLKNSEADIILPTLKISSINNTSIVKVVTDSKNKVLYLSRANIPFEFRKINKYIRKHLSVISFKPDALIEFSKSKQTELEKIEDIELLRALELGMKIKSLQLKGDSFSVDIVDDYHKATIRIRTDKFFKLYK